MLTDKKLLKRIKSLESFLGLQYAESTYEEGSYEHVADKNSWGFVGRIDELKEKVAPLLEKSKTTNV